MAEELQTARELIFDALAGVSAITDLIGGALNPRIYQDIAEQGDAFPLILIRALPASDDSQTASGYHIFSNTNWLIYAVQNRRSFKSISTLADLIFTTLHLRHFPYAEDGGRILYPRRLRPYQRSYPLDGKIYVESGGFYEMIVK